MAASRVHDAAGAPVLDALVRFLVTYSPEHVTLAYSGGLDSTVLLHALTTLQPRFDFELEAIHVHHGLNDQADRWAVHCMRFAQKLGVPCQVVRVEVNNPGHGLEAAARRLRYAALVERAQAWVLTAHHQRDQAETVLLNLLRGSGLHGLCGMAPVRWLSETIRLGRPFLSVPHAALVDYARHADLRWVEDESNRQLIFRRNWVRHRLLPLLLERFPAVEHKLAQTAEALRESRSLLADLARQDLSICENGDVLDCRCLTGLSLQRRHNLLRYWFEQRHGVVLTRNHLDGLDKLLHAREDAQPQVVIGPHVAVRFQNCLIYPKADLPDWSPCRWHGRVLAPFDFSGTLPADTWLVPLRETGLSIKPYKKAFQTAGVPPWQRPLWPVACREDRPAHILGVAPVKGAAPWPDAARVQVAPRGTIG